MQRQSAPSVHESGLLQFRFWRELSGLLQLDESVHEKKMKRLESVHEKTPRTYREEASCGVERWFDNDVGDGAKWCGGGAWKRRRWSVRLGISSRDNEAFLFLSEKTKEKSFKFSIIIKFKKNNLKY